MEGPPDARTTPTPQGTGISRRAVLLGGAFAAAASLSGCSFMTLEPRVSSTPVAPLPGQKEAPMLAGRVAAGTLPPLEQRLPVDPQVITPTDREGVYGGRWRSGMLGTVSVYQAYTYAASDALLTWDPDFTEPVPDIAESVEVLDGGKTFLFTLREGVRWSDGEPFTSDDVVFAYDEVMSHPDLLVSPPQEFTTDGTPGRIEKLDDRRFAFRFEGVNGMFLAHLAGPTGYILVLYPRHYLEQFHADHTPGADQAAQDAGFGGWGDHFFSKVGRGYWDLPRWQTTELPTVACWNVRTPLGQGSRLVLERNPYYYKVDPSGRQLPYLDEVVLEIIGDPQLMTIQASNGEITFPQSDVTTLDNKPVLAANRDRGRYHLVEAITAEQNQLSLQLNLNTEDLGLREVFLERDFRVALSLATDRRQIIDAVYQRQGEPWQLAPRRESPFYDEEMATQHTALDLDAANALLDGLGLTERDGNGLRLRRDGVPLTFDMAVITQRPSSISALDLISQQWRRVGVGMRVQSMDRSLFTQRRSLNQLDAAVGSAGGGLLDAMYDPRLWLPHNAECQWAPLWALWFMTDGAEGEEPIAPVLEQMELYRKLGRTLDMDEQMDLFRQVLAIAKREFYTIGVCLPAGDYSVVQDDFVNFPSTFISSFIYPTPGPMRPEQFSMEATAG